MRICQPHQQGLAIGRDAELTIARSLPAFAVAIAEEYTGLTTISYDDYNKEGGPAALHTFKDPFADVGLATALAAFNEKALAQIMPKKKEERPALPPIQIDPVVLTTLTTQPG